MLFRQLEYFRHVAEEESLTKSAKKLYISQPALSRSIKSLEKELGVPLFDREGRIIKLNRYGELFLEKVYESIQAIDEGKLILKELVDPFTGTIRISFIHTLGNNLVPEAISEFRKYYPDVKFKFYQGTTGTVLEHIESGVVDLCFLMEADFPENIAHETVKKEELFVIVPESHPLASESIIALSQLENEPFIGFKKGVGLRAITDKLCKQAGFTPNIVFEGQQVGTVSGFVSAGLGVSLVPKNRGISEYNIKCIPVTKPRSYRQINLAWKKDAYTPKVLETFKKFLYENISTIQI